MLKTKKYIIVPGDLGYQKEDLVEVDAYLYDDNLFVHKSLHYKNKWVISCNMCGRMVYASNGSMKQVLEKFEQSVVKQTYYKVLKDERFKVLVGMYNDLKIMKGVI